MENEVWVLFRFRCKNFLKKSKFSPKVPIKIYVNFNLFQKLCFSVLPTNGVLKKWTNYVNGWQDRYFEITEGNLVYYKSKCDKAHGCRGSIFLKNAIIAVSHLFLSKFIKLSYFQAHEFDECEFSIGMGENVIWYLKAENSQSKLLWMRSVVRETVSFCFWTIQKCRQNNQNSKNHCFKNQTSRSSASSFLVSPLLCLHLPSFLSLLRSITVQTPRSSSLQKTLSFCWSFLDFAPFRADNKSICSFGRQNVNNFVHWKNNSLQAYKFTPETFREK